TRRATVWRLAGRADRDLVASLLLALRDEHRDFSVLSSALSLLALSDVDIVGPLVEFLRDPDGNLRIQAAFALGDRPDPRGAAGAVPEGVRRAISASGTQRLLDAISRTGVDAEALATVLGWLDRPAAGRALARLLGSAGARRAVIDALVASGPHVVDGLLEQ